LDELAVIQVHHGERKKEWPSRPLLVRHVARLEGMAVYLAVPAQPVVARQADHGDHLGVAVFQVVPDESRVLARLGVGLVLAPAYLTHLAREQGRRLGGLWRGFLRHPSPPFRRLSRPPLSARPPPAPTAVPTG